MKNCFRKNRGKDPWQIAAARYCVAHAEKAFTVEELKKYIKSLYEVDDRFIEQFYSEEIFKPAGREHSRGFLTKKDGKGGNINFWVPPLDLVSKITDYDELKEARKNAKQAFWLSIIAIIISAITLIISIFK